MAIIYGIRAPRATSPGAAEFLYVHPRFMNALELGTMPPVDLFPLLALVPERWAGWKRTVIRIRELHEALFESLLRIVEVRLEKGLRSGAFMEEAIKNAKEWGLDRRDFLTLRIFFCSAILILTSVSTDYRNLGGVLIEGSDTSSVTLQIAVLALVAFPDAQRKAREEIDRVVGTERAPTWSDIPSLPYTMAFLEEVRQMPSANYRLF
jgi:hypothetical protein